jgi:hypothetical protein
MSIFKKLSRLNLEIYKFGHQEHLTVTHPYEHTHC